MFANKSHAKGLWTHVQASCANRRPRPAALFTSPTVGCGYALFREECGGEDPMARKVGAGAVDAHCLRIKMSHSEGPSLR